MKIIVVKVEPHEPAEFIGNAAKVMRILTGVVQRHFRLWRVAAGNRWPENPPSASAVRRIATIRDRLIFDTAALTAEGGVILNLCCNRKVGDKIRH